MTIRELLDKISSIGYSYDDRAVFHYGEKCLMQWAGNERYYPKDDNGNDIILERYSNNSYKVKVEYYNVIACFEMTGDEYSYYNSIDNIVKYINKSLSSGEMHEDESIYLIFGQDIKPDNIYEISDIVYDNNTVLLIAGDNKNL